MRRLKHAYQFGMEVETADYRGHAFWENSQVDLSGPREIATGIHTDVYGIINELAQYEIAIAGNSINMCTYNMEKRSCGNHIHVSIPQDYFNIYYECFRAFIPFFAPFFAASPARDEEDFRFRDEPHWFDVPPQLEREELENWVGRQYWYVTPYRGEPQLRLELRINEAPPQFAFRAIYKILEIAEAFVDAGYRPDFSDDVPRFARAVITNQLTTIDQLRVILTRDEDTAEILDGLFPDLAPTCDRIVALTEFRDDPMLARVINGETWSKEIAETESPDDRIDVTHALFVDHPVF